MQQRLQALAAQGLPAPAQRGSAQLALGLSRMQSAELAHQFVPHQALGKAAPQRHPDHQQHQGQQRTLPHPPRFACPGLTLPDAALDRFFGIHLGQQSHIHLLTHLVIHVHLP